MSARFHLACTFAPLLAVAFAVGADSQRLNGFVLDAPLVPASEVLHGGPGRDGIPAIDTPRFVAADAAKFLKPKDRVLGVTLDGMAKAYPVKILNHHEIVNDAFGARAVVVTYCPLCGSGVAFDGRVDGEDLDFGVSGLLYKSDVLLYDRHTESLWSQIRMQAVNGPLKGTHLKQIQTRHTSWQDWRGRHPDTRVLSTDTGYAFINYQVDPYADYKRDSGIWFPVGKIDRRLQIKDWVLGVVVGDKTKAYPMRKLRKLDSPVRDRIGGQDVTVEFDDEHQTAVAFDAHDEPLQSIQLYWFAWAAFHPDTDVFEP